MKQRRLLLADLSKKVGGDAELGRLLGHKTGGAIWQMIHGQRPVTEKTIAALEKIRHPALGSHGARGWFSVRPSGVEVAQMPPEYLQLLQDLEDIPPKRRSALLDHIHQVAEEAREAAEHLSSREKVPTAALRTSSKKSVSSLTYGDGNRRQKRLPLTTVDDPFTAEPDQRESALYRRIEQAPKAASGTQRRMEE